MNRYTAYIMTIFLSLLIIVGLAGCGESLEKPTGLEGKDSHQIETTDKEMKKEDPDKTKSDTEKGEANQDSSTETDEGILDSTDEDKKKETVSDKDTETSKSESKQKSSKNDTKKSHKDASKNRNSSSSSKEDNIKDKSNDDVKDDTKKKTKNKKEQSDKENPKDNKKDPKKEENKSKPNKPTITHSIVIAADGSSGQQWCKDNPGKGGCPDDGSAEVPLPTTEMKITEEETVLDALIRITKQNKIQMDYRGGQGATAYIQGMGNVYEFDRGQGSGWMFRINGIFPDRGAGVVPLCDGDTVEWLYTNNLGNDLGADLKPVRRDGKCPK